MVLILILLVVLTIIGMSLLFTTEVELKTSKANFDHATALSIADDAITEVLWRFDLTQDAAAPPTGSQISVNSLSNYDAFIDFDPNDILFNDVDDDLDGTVDEVDELNLTRGWEVRIVLTPDVPSPGGPMTTDDTVVAAGPPWGSRYVIPTVQSQTDWQPYSTSDPTSTDVLTVRFQLDTDTTVGDSEGDGAEIVFYDEQLALNGTEDKNTLSALGGDGNPANDSPYNITYFDGATTYPASGSPVLIINATGTVTQAGKVLAERKIEAQALGVLRPAYSKALCGCDSLDVSGAFSTDSYNSSAGSYGIGPVYNAYANMGSNGNVIKSSSGDLLGNIEAGGWVSVNGSGQVVGTAVAGAAITESGQFTGTLHPNQTPVPQPCQCNAFDLPALIPAAMATNDNSSLPVSAQGADLVLTGTDTLTLAAGTYYWDSIHISGSASIALSSAPVLIYVAGEIDLGGGGVLNPGSPADLQLFSGAVAPEEVKLFGSSEFRGLVWAPDSDMEIGSALNGAAVGGVLDYTSGDIHYDLDLQYLYRVRAGADLLTWREVP